jgi:hypothetical protein
VLGEVTITDHDRGEIQMPCRAQRLKAAAGAAIVAVVTVAGCSPAPHAAPIAATAPPTPARTTSPPPPPLTGTASVTRRHPMTDTKVGVRVSTAPGAWITVIAHFQAGGRKKTARADTAGRHTFWFPVSTATPGARVKVDVQVSAYGQKRTTRVWFTPRQPPPPPASPAAPAVAFGCSVLQTGAGGQEEFNVTTTGGGSYSGTVNVSFYDYPGSGHIFPPATVQGATPAGSWQPVPAADIGASAEPSGCIASAG